MCNQGRPCSGEIGDDATKEHREDELSPLVNPMKLDKRSDCLDYGASNVYRG